jgi:gliding motility-associated-like protein
VNFTPAGAATYYNNGCSAPVDPFTVDAGSNPTSVCAGNAVSLTGTAQGQTSVSWTAPEGTFSSGSALSTNFTTPLTATGNITVTLTATNACGATITDTVIVAITPAVTPTFTLATALCNGQAAPLLPSQSNNGINGTWAPSTVSSTTSGSYVFTPNNSQCAVPYTLDVTVSAGTITPTFNAVPAICSGETLAALPTTSTNSINGTWSPTLNNTATTTYTFTPAAGQCATTTTLTITVNPSVTPTFTAVPAICSGETLAALPTTSTNSINGTWAPALDNTTTTTYTFTPSAGQCATTQTLTITVNPSITPTFNAVPAICSGETLSALPTTSITGISGTWSPALNNTASTTYTFTPNAGQCAINTTLTIIVNPNITPTFTAVPAICSGGTLAALPTTSNNSINGTWAPALDNTTTTTYTFTPAAGQCATTQTLTITVNPIITPTFNAVPAICSGGTLAALPTISTNSINGTWAPALDNTATTTYTFTPAAGQCATTQTMTITVNPIVTPTFTAVPAICSGGTLTALPTTSTNSINGTWAPTLNNTATTTYTFTPTAGQCSTNQTLTITVNPNITPTFNAIAPICSGGTLTALPTTSTNSITGSWAPALNNTATTTYSFTPSAGQCATTQTLTITVNPNITPTFNAVAPICSGGTLTALPTTSTNSINGTWAPALNNTATTTYTFTPAAGQCATTQTLTITVNPIVTPTFTAVPAICSGGTLTALPSTSTNSINGTWSPALNNTATTTYTFTPSAGQCATTQTLTITVNPNTAPTFNAVAPICSGGTLTALPTTSTNSITGSWAPALNNTATTTYTFTPSAGQCATTQTLTITVNPNITPTFNAVAPICSGETLSALPTISTNSINGTWAPALNNTATTTYTFTPTAGQCATTQTLTIIVNPNITPTFTSVNPICEGDNLFPLPTTSNNGITGSWAPALNNTTTTTYTFSPNAGQCATSTTLTIVVNTIGGVTPITGNDTVCISDTLQLANATAGGTWSSSNVDAATVDNDGLVTPIGPGFSTITYTTTSICNSTTLDITVYLPPNPLLTNRFICVDKVTGNYISTVNMQCGVPNADHTFVWTLDGQPLPTTTNLHVATEEGLYEVTVTNNTTGCIGVASADVLKSSIAIAEAIVEKDFDNNQNITVTVTGGSGDYLYQLDDNWPQEDNHFIVQQGLYTITVIDKNGCGVETLSVFALNYPRYFTPNNDGYNDTWFIEGLSQQQEAQIYIFDRYGKLVKAIRPYLNEFWDGTLNGYPLPSTDYWFTLNYTDRAGLLKEFRSHFSLKR